MFNLLNLSFFPILLYRALNFFYRRSKQLKIAMIIKPFYIVVLLNYFVMLFVDVIVLLLLLLLLSSVCWFVCCIGVSVFMCFRGVFVLLPIKFCCCFINDLLLYRVSFFTLIKCIYCWLSMSYCCCPYFGLFVIYLLDVSLRLIMPCCVSVT